MSASSPIDSVERTGPCRGARTRGAGSVIDLFCGAGGLSHGFKPEGFDVVAASYIYIYI